MEEIKLFQDCVTPDHDRRTFDCVANGIFPYTAPACQFVLQELGRYWGTEITAELLRV